MNRGRVAPLLASLALAAATGLVHGRWTGRWNPPSDLANESARLARVPFEIDGWRGENSWIDPRQLEAGQIAGHLSRSYRPNDGGEPVTVLLVLGKPGPIAVHTPDVCYTASGFDAVGVSRRVSFPGDQSSSPRFWRGEFGRSRGVISDSRRILWSWTTDGRWDAPDHPRMSYATQRLLYKLYLIQEVESDVTSPSDDRVLAFAGAFLPVLNHALFDFPPGVVFAPGGPAK